ncbi:heterokaryon incompatibility protein-domain-containing protein [Xylaria telfairii]|nr:heterokaryon incompatibility protein-domain-containing protein [Xylaria telfairii]
MYLINTRTLQLKDFLEGKQESYVILSHTWGNEEVSFQDLERYHTDQSFAEALSLREGFKKITHCCETAFEEGFDWAWIDTCCINKTSSTELSEAINSMFKWYEQSAVCYAFLADVLDTREDLAGHDSSFRRSRWFTRGWTLQELLAPKHLRFYNQWWEVLGQMTAEPELCNVVSDITTIQPDCLDKKTAISEVCVAKRMSWASRRETTRKEDIAYCLLGIFGVNMPLLYGEGPRAFIRLQKEIINNTNDYSILAWGTLILGSQYPSNQGQCQDPLALSPDMFKDCYDFEVRFRAKTRIQWTSDGIQAGLVLRRDSGSFSAGLNCFSWRFPLHIISIVIDPQRAVGATTTEVEVRRMSDYLFVSHPYFGKYYATTILNASATTALRIYRGALLHLHGAKSEIAIKIPEGHI